MKGLRTVVAVAGAALWLAGCGGKSKDEEAKDILIQRGASKEEIQKLAEKGLPYLKRILDSQYKETRLAAITAVGLIRDDPEATKILVEKTKEKDAPEEVYFAIIALGTQRAAEAKDIIQQFFQSPDPRYREAACAAIYELGDKALYPLLAQALNDQDVMVQQAAQRFRQMIRTGRESP